MSTTVRVAELRVCVIKPAAGGEWEYVLWTHTPFKARS